MGIKHREADRLVLKPLPDAQHKDYFHILVENCIAAYGRVFSDKLALDLNRVGGKMRALVLEDVHYIQETRNLKARQVLEEIGKLEYLASLASGEAPDAEDEDPRAKGAGRKKSSVDRDMLTMQFKAAQMLRDVRNWNNDADEAEEKDAVNVFYVPASAEDILKLAAVEVVEGSGDADMDELLDRKERLPESSSGRVRLKGRTKEPIEPAYREYEDGTVEEL
jgi:hypothetical protein